jgi:hypothetical protein
MVRHYKERLFEIKCDNCGARYNEHRRIGETCPKNGKGYSQWSLEDPQWRETHFISKKLDEFFETF